MLSYFIRIGTWILLAFFSSASVSQGFRAGSEGRAEREEKEIKKLNLLVGQRFWLNFGERAVGCRSEVRSEPSQKYQLYYQSPIPVQAEVLEVVKGDTNNWYKLLINEKDLGYMPSHIFRPHVGEIEEVHLRYVCVLPISPQEATERIAAKKAEEEEKMAAALAAVENERLSEEKVKAAQARKPGVAIGMTVKQVAEGTSWGRPHRVNRTTNASGVYEQWVYGSGNYLYFRNGVLHSIQN